MSKINVGIIGCGVIGNALIEWLESNNPNCAILRVDPAKNFNDDISKADIVFISIHVPTENDGSQNLLTIENIIQTCPNVPIYIRTTIKPHTADFLSKKCNKNVYFMPEFLTERTAIDDFKSQAMVFTGDIDLLKKVFINKAYIEMTSLEAEITKYAHNVFGALKVTYFNGINELCEKTGADYTKILKGVLLSGYVNETHTAVPGPDGAYGYGGKCFPKDILAFIDSVKDIELGKLLNQIPTINNSYRNKKG